MSDKINDGGLTETNLTLLDWFAASCACTPESADIIEKMGWKTRDGMNWKDIPKNEHGEPLVPSFAELWVKLTRADRRRIISELQYENARAMLKDREAK